MGPLALTGVVCGLLYGYGAQRGDFCMDSAVRAFAQGGDRARFKAFGLTLSLQLMLLPLLFGMGMATPSLPQFQPATAILGGLLFGLCVAPAGGTASSLLYKVGAGSGGAALALVGFAGGAVLTERGPLSPLRVALQSWGASAGNWDLSLWLGLPPSILAPVLGALCLVLLWRSPAADAGVWSFRRTGLWLGVIALAAWLLSHLVGRDYGPAVLPGVLALCFVSELGWGEAALWDVGFVLCIPAGAYLAERLRAGVRFHMDAPQRVLGRLLGGAGLGMGASLAAGDALGHGLSGVPQLVTASIAAGAAMLLGRAALVRFVD